MFLFFVSKTFRRMGFPSMTDKLICVFLAIKYGPYFLATLVGRVPVLAAQHSTNVAGSLGFEHNDQEKKTGPRMPMLSSSSAQCPVRRCRAAPYPHSHRSITPIGMAGMAPDSGNGSCVQWSRPGRLKFHRIALKSWCACKITRRSDAFL